MNWYAIYNKETKRWTVATVRALVGKRTEVLYTPAMTEEEVGEWLRKCEIFIPVSRCYGSMKTFRERVLKIKTKLNQ